MTTPINAFPIADQADVANIVTNVDELTDALDVVGVPRFATKVVRDAAIPSPTDGMVCWCDDTGEMYIRKGSWVSLVPRIIFKTVDQDAGTTTYRDDNELFLPLEASSRYIGEVILMYTGHISGDIKFTFTGPSGFTVQALNIDALDVAAVNIGLSVLLDSVLDMIGGPLSLGAISSSEFVGFRLKLMINTTNAGTLKSRWAQATANGTTTVVRKGSSLELSKIP